MDIMASVHRRDMKSRAERRLKRVDSNVSLITGLSSLAGSVRSIASSTGSRGDSLRSKASWSSLAGRQGKAAIEPDQDFSWSLASYTDSAVPRQAYPEITPEEPDAEDDDDYEHHNATRDGGVVAVGNESSSEEPTDHGCVLDHLDPDGVPTTYSEDQGSAFTEDYVMQVEQELQEARENAHRARKKLKHYTLLYDEALQSKDYDKPPSRCPDPSPFLAPYYDRAVMDTTATPRDEQEVSTPRVPATRRCWDVMAKGEVKVEKWRQAVDEWEEAVVQLHAEIMSFQIDLDVVFSEGEEVVEEEVELKDCECGCQGRRGSAKCRKSHSSWSRSIKSRSSSSSTSRRTSSSEYSTRYTW